MLTYSTEALGNPAAKARHWREICAENFAGLDVIPIGTGSFDNRLSCVDIGGLRLSEACSMPARVERPRANGGADLYFLHLQVKGDMASEHRGHSAVLECGDLVMCESMSPYRFVLSKEAQTLILAVPGATLREHLPSPQDALGFRLDGRSGAAALAAAFLQDLWRHSTALEKSPPEIGMRVVGHFLDLFATALAEHRGAAITDTASAGARRAQIRSCIEANLRNPEFGLKDIAAEIGASDRYVRKLFENEGETIAERVQRRRLEESARQLRDPLWRSHTITEIAFSWGFNSSSHFTRTFKVRYGMSPLEYRRQNA